MKHLSNKKIFVVHGRDCELLSDVKEFLLNAGWKPVILSEEANNGKTIIEKFERHSDVACAVVLCTACDVGRYRSGDKEKERGRARQNVILEYGYFLGKLGRENVILLLDEEIEKPSDIEGMGYITLPKWQNELLKELNLIEKSRKTKPTEQNPQEAALNAAVLDLVLYLHENGHCSKQQIELALKDKGWKSVEFVYIMAEKNKLVATATDGLEYCTDKGVEQLILNGKLKI